MKFWADGQQPFPYRVMEELLVIREQRLKTATIACEAPLLYSRTNGQAPACVLRLGTGITAVLRTPLSLVSGWECRRRRLSRA
jgi:hypothetical protein